jgi:hypothetical protein
VLLDRTQLDYDAYAAALAGRQAAALFPAPEGRAHGTRRR